jgi:hypothetical protein
MTPRQSATALVLLTALYCAALVFLAPQVELLFSPLQLTSRPAVLEWLLAGIMAGAAAASPPFLAIWAVHGRERTSVRLPLTTWLLDLFYLGVLVR